MQSLEQQNLLRQKSYLTNSVLIYMSTDMQMGGCHFIFDKQLLESVPLSLFNIVINPFPESPTVFLMLQLFFHPFLLIV